MNKVSVILLFLYVSLAFAYSQPKPFPELREIGSPASNGSALPFLQSTPDGTILMSWVEPGRRAKHALRMAEFDGERWSSARTVVEGDSFFANWADVPSVVKLRDGRCVAHWLNKSGPGTHAYDVKVRTSTDGGRTWSPTMSPHRDGTQTEHGFVSIFNLPTENAGLVWLDGRAMAGHGTANHDDHAEPAAGGERGSMTLRFARLEAHNTIADEVLLDERICECCPTAAATTHNAVVVAYRDRSEDEIRDIAIARFQEGTWSAGRPVHNDGWNISGCPVNGPALSTDGKNVVLAWYTAANGEPRVKVAFSDDEGKSFDDPIIVSDHVPLGRVDVELLPDGSAFVLWLEWGAEEGSLLVRRVFRDGTMSVTSTVASVTADRASGYPRMARMGDRLVFAWTETQPAKSVKTAIAPIPALSHEVSVE